MHPLLIARVLGLFALLFGVTLTAPIGIALIHGETDLTPFLEPLAGSLVLGFVLWVGGELGPRLGGGAHGDLGVRDGFLIVALFWFLLSTLGAWPLVLGVGLSPVDALFEAASGLTTTGATVITGLDALPRSLLFYRQELQWLGGMGVVVLGLAIIPLLGIGGMQLYRAEAPGPLKEEKLTPRLVGTARSLWLLYLGLTAACALGYWLAGMSVFDAVSHSLSTVSTGGFSTHDDSIGYYNSPVVEGVSIVFMLLAAINFGLHFVVWNKLDPRLYLRDPEARSFLIFVFAVVLVVSLMLWLEHVYPGPLKGVREAAFTVVSLVTSTGFATVDHAHWPDFLPVLLMIAAFVGGCGGSTAGGIKVLRVVLLSKQGLYEVRRLIHPRAMTPVRVGNRVVDAQLMQSVWGYFALYMMTFVLCGLWMIHAGLDPVSAFAAVATSINNLGPGLGEVAYNFQTVSDQGKLVAVAAMLLGRLEIFTILVLLTPGFWRG
ncbi:MAG: TrkH family potassium uptake protein [Thiohalocapsa sp.]|uniref:TrkH family potassium uptake protein n=1 Tax=Thiohalocapsa sp. TaxID=2497641 RepID=UPI0025EF6372|nr:TrkH family potassium uptake protein [Thiohalocapsa sp.]MCG6943651.1 TrkH family potassium uptake protein [Thiohalocapsa sp.]